MGVRGAPYQRRLLMRGLHQLTALAVKIVAALSRSRQARARGRGSVHACVELVSEEQEVYCSQLRCRIGGGLVRQEM